MSLLSPVMRATLLKDIRLEWRSKDALNSMLFFSLLVVVIFSFSFDPNAEESRQIAPGLIWVAFLFSTVVALNQTWARELRNQALDAYRQANWAADTHLKNDANSGGKTVTNTLIFAMTDLAAIVAAQRALVVE